MYLAGPIGGLNYGSATEWQANATRELARLGVIPLSPMHSKFYLLAETKLDAIEHTQPLSSPKGLTTRDRNDVRTCDLVLANLFGATRVSIELAWADLLHTPVVLVSESGNVHDYPMLSEMVGFRVTTLIEAYALVGAVLGSPP